MQRQIMKPGYGMVLTLVLGVLLAGCGGDDDKDVARGDLPGAPTSASAQAADGIALVRWMPPSTDGGSPLLYYVVRCEPVCGGAIVAADVLQATVRGLNNGFSYVFKVSAVNARGESPSSLPTELVTPMAGVEVANPTVPGQPRAIRATAGNGGAYVSWLPPASFGGRPLLSYRVTAEPGGFTTKEPLSPKEAGAFIEGLTNSRPYQLKVVATNELGDGPEASVVVWPQAGGAPASWVAGYWVGYGASTGAYLPVDEVDFSGITHLMVGRFKPLRDGLVNTDLDVSSHEGPLMAKALAKRAHEHGRKALMMLGGDGEGDKLTSATSPQSRPFFVQNLLKVMDELGFDGIDVDWEPIRLAAEAPDNAPIIDEGERLLALLDDLRAARPGIILTVPVYPENLNFGISRARADFMKQLAARVDQLNIMSYAMSYGHGGWESWHSSPLLDNTANRPASVKGSVELYLKAGVPPGRLGVGTGFFGQCYRRVTQPRVLLSDGTQVGPGDNEMSYKNILNHYYQPEAYHWDDGAKVPYLSFPSPAGPNLCNYISYEDERSIAAKGRYVRDEGLGGTIIWTLNQGYLPHAPPGQRNPLIQSMKRAFLDP